MSADRNRYEFTDADHATLLELLMGLPCRVMVSGHSSALLMRCGRTAAGSLYRRQPVPSNQFGRVMVLDWRVFTPHRQGARPKGPPEAFGKQLHRAPQDEFRVHLRDACYPGTGHPARRCPSLQPIQPSRDAQRHAAAPRQRAAHDSTLPVPHKMPDALANRRRQGESLKPLRIRIQQKPLRALRYLNRNRLQR